MTRATQGRWLLFLGGALLVAGFAWPELRVAVGNALDAARTSGAHAHGAPQRSHWFVLQENLDMLSEPDETSPAYFTVWYGVQVAGLAWFGLAGAVLALSALFSRSRFVAALISCFHGGALLLLAGGATYVFASLPPPSPGHSALVTLGPVVLLWVLFLGQTFLSFKAVSGGMARFVAVDVANALPLLFLLLANAGLWIALRGHPNWPASGYLVGAIGAALALLGVLRRGR